MPKLFPKESERSRQATIARLLASGILRSGLPFCSSKQKPRPEPGFLLDQLTSEGRIRS
jgi:hypothetical protein